MNSSKMQRRAGRSTGVLITTMSKELRVSLGYDLEEASVVTGLTIDEIKEAEDGQGEAAVVSRIHQRLGKRWRNPE